MRLCGISRRTSCGADDWPDNPFTSKFMKARFIQRIPLFVTELIHTRKKKNARNVQTQNSKYHPVNYAFCAL